MKYKSIPDVVRRWLNYNKETGILIWNFRPRFDFKKERDFKVWNIRFADKIAGTIGKPYIDLRIEGKPYQAHRIIVYLMTYKRWTDKNGVEWESWEEWKEVDHINGIKTDNRWTNLQPADRSGNNCNKGKHIDNKSGLKGVSETKNGKYSAFIQTNRRAEYLGTFDNKWEAHFYYCFWSHVFHGKFARE